MKKFFIGLMVIAFVASGATFAQADTEEFVTGMGNKIVRGVVNTFTGWIEFPEQIIKGYDRGFMGNEDQKLLGAVVGIFSGIGHSAGRTLSGVSDLAGFWAADPESNEGIGIPLDAEYAWEEGTGYDMFDPNLIEGAVKPIGNKLLRGLGNGIFGFLEFPGQIIKGVKEGAPDLGIIKGLWYWYSREVDGVYEATTFLLPNPASTKGMPFDEKWAWSALGDNLK